MAEDDTDDSSSHYIESVDVVGSTATSIEVAWKVVGENLQSIQGFQVHFHKIGSRYNQNSPLLSATTTEYSVGNLIMDTYYKVCLLMYRNDTTTTPSKCVDGSTTNWHIPVSIGSSIGAVLALSIIVFLVLVSRCPSIKRRKRKTVSDSGKYDSMSSHAHDDNYELSDTTTHAQDEEIFADHDSGNFEMAQPLHVHPRDLHQHGYAERGANSNRNFIKPNIPAHVLHIHSSRTSGGPHRVREENYSHKSREDNHSQKSREDNHSHKPRGDNSSQKPRDDSHTHKSREDPVPIPRHTVVKLEHTTCSRQHTV